MLSALGLVPAPQLRAVQRLVTWAHDVQYALLHTSQQKIQHNRKPGRTRDSQFNLEAPPGLGKPGVEAASEVPLAVRVPPVSSSDARDDDS